MSELHQAVSAVALMLKDAPGMGNAAAFGLSEPDAFPYAVVYPRGSSYSPQDQSWELTTHQLEAHVLFPLVPDFEAATLTAASFLATLRAHVRAHDGAVDSSTVLLTHASVGTRTFRTADYAVVVLMLTVSASDVNDRAIGNPYA